MNARSLCAIWFIAITLSIIFTLGIIHYPTLNTVPEPAEEVIPFAPIMIIGSSLMRFAVPGIGSGQDGGILGDGTAHTRLAISAIREEQVLRLLERILHQSYPVKTIFLEPIPLFLILPLNAVKTVLVPIIRYGWLLYFSKKAKKLL